MNFTYSRYLKPEFQQWVNEHLAVIQEFFTPSVAEEYGTLEDFAVELYLTIKAGD